MILQYAVMNFKGDIGIATPLYSRHLDTETLAQPFALKVHWEGKEDEPLAYVIEDDKSAMVIAHDFAHEKLEFLGEM